MQWLCGCYFLDLLVPIFLSHSPSVTYSFSSLTSSYLSLPFSLGLPPWIKYQITIPFTWHTRLLKSRVYPHSLNNIVGHKELGVLEVMSLFFLLPLSQYLPSPFPFPFPVHLNSMDGLWTVLTLYYCYYRVCRIKYIGALIHACNTFFCFLSNV